MVLLEKEIQKIPCTTKMSFTIFLTVRQVAVESHRTKSVKLHNKIITCGLSSFQFLPVYIRIQAASLSFQ